MLIKLFFMTFLTANNLVECHWSPMGLYGDIRTKDDIACAQKIGTYNSNAILSLAIYYQAKGDNENAIRYYEKLVEIGNNPRGIIHYVAYLGRGSDRYVPLLKKAFESNSYFGYQAAEILLNYYELKGDEENALFWAKQAARGCSFYATDFLIKNLEDVTEQFFHMTYQAMSTSTNNEEQLKLQAFFSENAGKIDMVKFVQLASEKWCTPLALEHLIEIERGNSLYH